MLKKQCSLDLFFNSKNKESSAILYQKKVEDKATIPIEDPQVSKDFPPDDLISRSSSPHPIAMESETSLGLLVAQNPSSADEDQNNQSHEENPLPHSEEKIIVPSWNQKEKENFKNQDQIQMAQGERVTLHWELEIIEHRIQVGKDEKHFHPASAPDVLRDGKLDGVRPRELTRLKHYEETKYVECIPDFWPQRCWDDEYIHLNHVQSQFLLQEIAEAPFKERKSSDDSSSTSPSASSSDESSDDETKVKPRPQKTKIVTKARIQKPVEKIPDNPKTKLKPISVRLSSLLFDTDDECDTDLEDF